MIVRAEDAEPNGLASMLAGLIASNLARRPARRALLRPAVVVLTSVDAEVSATIRIEPGVVRVASGVAAPAERAVTIAAPSSDLLALASVPLRLGLPDPTTAAGRAVVASVVRGRTRVTGALGRPLALPRVARLLSAN